MSLSSDTWKKLRAHAEADRIDAWDELDENCSKYVWTDDDVTDLFMRLKQEESEKVKIHGLICLVRIQRWVLEYAKVASARIAPISLQNWLLQSFLPVSEKQSAASGGARSAVVAVCDHEHIRDVQPLIKLARVLHEDAFGNTAFHLVPLRNPDWARVGLAGLTAVCFIGRPSMFVGCDLLKQLPQDRHFKLPEDSGTWRSQPLSHKTADEFHHVIQQRSHADGLLFKAMAHRDAQEMEIQRTDYAVVQRFLVRYGGHDTTVLILAGATSLGTVAAAEFLTSRSAVNSDLRSRITAAGKNLKAETRVEILLKAEAAVHAPPLPWEVEYTEEKLFVDDTDVLRRKVTVSIGPSSGHQIPYILLNGDKVSLPPKARELLLAICRVAKRDKTDTVDLRKLRDKNVWRMKHIPFTSASDEQVARAIRDSLKKKWLRDAVTFEREDGYPVLKLRFEIIAE